MPSFIIARTITLATNHAREKGWRLKNAAECVWETPDGEEVKYMTDARNGYLWSGVERNSKVYCASGWERRKDFSELSRLFGIEKLKKIVL